MKISIKLVTFLFYACLSTLSVNAVDYSFGRDISDPASSAVLSCGAGQTIVGINIRAGSYVDGMRVRCRSLTGQVTLGRGVFGRNFPLPQNALSRANCVDGQILVGISGRSGVFVDQISSIICRTPSRGVRTTVFTPVDRGGNGGRGFSVLCPTGEHISSMVIKVNAWINHLKVSCEVIPQNLLSNDEDSTTAGSSANEVFCFGAVGMNCGTQMLEAAACVNILGRTNCLVNEGSWGHDECCFRTNERGTWCGPQNAFSPGCEREWNDSIRYTPMPFGSWVRSVNSNLRDTDGLVDHNLYCAQRGTILPREVTQRCCSRSAAPLEGIVNLMFPSGKMICR